MSRSPGDLVALAGLGTNGTYPSHCHHELMALLRRQFPHCPEPDPFPLPMKVLKAQGEEESVQEMDHSIIHAYKWFHYLHQHQPQDCSNK